MWTFRFSAPPNPGAPAARTMRSGVGIAEGSPRPRRVHQRDRARGHGSADADAPRAAARARPPCTGRGARPAGSGSDAAASVPTAVSGHRDDVVHQCGALGHGPSTTARISAAFAREGDQTLGTARTAPEPGKPSCQPPTGQERVKLLLDKARHALAVAQERGLGQERPQVVAHDPMQHVRGGVARRVVDRRQGHRARLGRSRAGARGASARDVVETRRVAGAVSAYRGDGAGRSYCQCRTRRRAGRPISAFRVPHHANRRGAPR